MTRGTPETQWTKRCDDHLVKIERGVRWRPAHVDAQLRDIAQVAKLKLSFQQIPFPADTGTDAARDNLQEFLMILDY